MPVEQIVDNKPKEIAVSVPEDVLRELKWLAEIMGVPPSIALRHAIATDSYIQNELNKKSKFLVKKENNLTHEIFWTDPKEVVKALDSPAS
jgi:hypothetical protein